jgi:hypothetical protein
VNLVADCADLIERLSGGIVELPVLVALAGKERTLVAAAHRHNDVRLAHGISLEQPWQLRGYIDTHLRHRLHGGWVDFVRWV